MLNILLGNAELKIPTQETFKQAFEYIKSF